MNIVSSGQEKSRKKSIWFKDFFKHRQHPIKIINYTSKNIWLLLIPVSKYLIATSFDFQNWIKTNWVDILTIIGIFAFAVLRWIFVYFEMEEDGIVAHTGLFGMFKTKVYFNEVTTFSQTQGYLHKAVNACTLYIETNADSIPKNIKLVLTEKNVDEVYKAVTAKSKHLPKFSISPRKTYLLVFSFLFSSTLSGTLLFATFIYEVYKLFGRNFEENIFRHLNGEITRIDDKYLKLTSTIPRAILILGGLVLGGWVISFIANLMRHWSFKATRCGSKYIIQSGVMSRRKHVINRAKINFFDIQQSLLMKIFKISSVTMYCTGYGKQRREISALIPITTEHEMSNSLRLLYPEMPKPSAEVTTGIKELFMFTKVPLFCSFIPPIAGQIAKHFLSVWHTEINYFMVILTIPFVWFLIVRITATFTTSIGFKNDFCTLSYCTIYKFHRIIIPQENISKVVVSRNIFQRRNGRCNVIIYSNSESTKFHKVKYLDYEMVRDICIREGYLMDC